MAVIMIYNAPAQVAAVNIPVTQELVPDTVYPELHVGEQVAPLTRVAVQSPPPPFVGAAEASQGSAAKNNETH